MKTLAFTLLSLTVATVGIAADAQQVRPELQNKYRFPDPAPPAAMPGAKGVLGTNGVQRSDAIGAAPMFLTLSGTSATDISGRSIGTVQYAMVGPNGSLDLAVLNINGRLVPVPWQLMSTGTDATPGRVALTANVDRQRLLQAPAVTVGQLSQLQQDPALQGIYGYYGLQAPNQIAAQGSLGAQTNALTGGATNIMGVSTNIAPPTATNTAPSGTNAISPPPATGTGAISPPQTTPSTSSDPSGQRPQISPPPYAGPGSQGTPPPAPQPTPGQSPR